MALADQTITGWAGNCIDIDGYVQNGSVSRKGVLASIVVGIIEGAMLLQKRLIRPSSTNGPGGMMIA